MADNWWESSSSRNRFESGPSPSSSIMALGGSFGWPTEIVDIKTAAARSSCNLVVDSSSSSSPHITSSSLPPPSSSLLQINNLFQDSHHHLHHNKLQLLHPAAAATATDPSLHMMGLDLDLSPSQASLDWNQPNLFRGDQKGEGSFRNMLQGDHLSSNTSSFNQETTQMASSIQQQHWRSPKNMYSSSPSEDSSVNDFKQQIGNPGFQLDQPAVQYSDNNISSSIITTCQGLPITSSNFPMDDSYGSPSTILQGLFGSSSDNNNIHQQQQQQQSGLDHSRSIYNSSYQSNYIGMNELSPSSTSTNWSIKYSPQDQLIPGNLSPPKQATATINSNSPLHFSNNARFWNADVNDVRSSFFPSLQMQLPSSTFDDKPKITSESVKKSSSEPSTKRPRNETQSPLPAFKVRKEKMGDRITALQQLVSPFGKTDTASVLSEAIEYIRFLHEQVSVLSTPYMKNGAPTIQHQQQQTSDKSLEGAKQDLRSRGLCLVPVSSTFPMTHETTVDFWTPTFGGTFR